MKKIHDILKSRKKNLHVTHAKKPLHTDFHSSIFERPLFCRRNIRLSTIAAAMDAKTEPKVDKTKQEKEVHANPQHSQLSSMQFFRPKQLTSTKKLVSKKEDEGDSGIDKLDKERIARLRELLNDVINHPGTLTPQMFWVLFMKIAPHFSLSTAGCVRVSALFWLMLSYIKAKNKNKKRKLKEQLTEAAELLEKEDAEVMVRVKRR